MLLVDRPTTPLSRAGLVIKRVQSPTRKLAGRPAQANPTAVDHQPLTKQDLVDYLASGCKPRDRWRFGTEHEKLGYYDKSKKRLSYDTIAAILNGLCDRFGWLPMVEEGKIIGASFDGQSVTIEPGGQLELSGAPVHTIQETCAEVNNHLYQVKTLAAELGVHFLGLGFDPKWSVAEVPIMPKERYRIMREYMPRVGSLGHDMMFRSCTIQVNLDFESEEDMVQKARIGLALQPVATALFANSPFRDGSDTGFQSWRSNVWRDTDAERTGILPFVWEPGFGFAAYVEYALDVPMYFTYQQGAYKAATKHRTTFRDYMEGNLYVNPGALPSMKDWETHLTTIFPEIRLKKYLEMRGADGGPSGIICALPALWGGLLYDREAQAEAYKLAMSFTAEEHRQLREQVPRRGLHTPFRDGTLRDLASQVLAIARRGLEARGHGEVDFLEPLEDIVKSGKTQADKLVELYHGPWQKSVDPAYMPEFTY